MRLGILTMTVVSSAPVVFAQDADLTRTLTEGVRCFGSNAKEDFGYNIKKLEVSPEAIGTALAGIAADETQCAPMREAAADLAKTYVVTPPPSDEEIAAESARKALAQTLAEADRRVGTLKFEVGPPPRNMTSSRPSALGFGQ